MEEVQEQSQEHYQDGSPLAGIRKRREELLEERHLDLDVPGYNGELVARYRPVEWEDMKKIGERTEKSKNPRKELLAQADTLILACESLWTRNGTGELKPLIPDEDEPVRYDERLAEYLKFEAKNARQALFGLFVNDIAVTAHHNDVAEWMQNTSVEVDEDLLGE